MEITLNNIGKIKNASVIIDGLTVIAGENDTGKSTIGKLVFSIIKAFGRYENDFNENKAHKIEKLLDTFYFQIRKYRTSNQIKIREYFFPPKFFNELELFIDKKSQISLFDDLKLEYVNRVIQLKKDAINEILTEKKDIITFEKKLDEIKNVILRNEKEIDKIQNALNKAFVSEFYSELSPKHLKKGISTINITETGKKLIEIEVENNKVNKIQNNGKLSLQDVTFVESPIIIQMYEAIQSATTMFELETETDQNRRLFASNNHKVSLHNKDLVSKLKEAEYFEKGILSPSEKSTNILNKLNKIIDGSFDFNNDDKDFIYVRNMGKTKSYKIRSINQASGIKSFGLLSMLIKSGRISNKNLLILDEPETNLHPKWQIEYAKIVIELVKNNIPVLITTHSPYMLQAIKCFSEESKINTNYYLADFSDKLNRSSVIENVNTDLNKIFKKLSDPIQNLVWQK